jgi:hypothetical protein
VEIVIAIAIVIFLAIVAFLGWLLLSTIEMIGFYFEKGRIKAQKLNQNEEM